MKTDLYEIGLNIQNLWRSTHKTSSSIKNQHNTNVFVVENIMLLQHNVFHAMKDLKLPILSRSIKFARVTHIQLSSSNLP